MSKDPHRNSNSQIGRHDAAGVTITFVNRLTGDRQTAHWPAKSKREAVRTLCEMFDPNVWRADTVSTPQSIYDDLTFSRKLIEPTDKWRGRDKGSRRMTIQRSTGGTIGPERTLLGGAGCSAWL